MALVQAIPMEGRRRKVTSEEAVTVVNILKDVNERSKANPGQSALKDHRVGSLIALVFLPGG